MNRNVEQKRRIQEARIQKQFSDVASGVKSKSLFEKTDFVITDQTGYNFNVNYITVETLYTEHSRLFYNVHPTFIFNSVIIRQQSGIENV